MKRHRIGTLGLCLSLVMSSTGLAQQPAQQVVPAPGQQEQPAYQTGMIPSPHILVPNGFELTGMVFLLSDAKGWGEAEEAEARTLVEAGAAVVGIDFPSYIQSLSQDAGDCIYTISDIEDLSQQVQRRLGNRDYRHPILAGAGSGGALVLGMIAQSPLATIGGALAVDPAEAVPLQKQLCTPASKQPTENGIVYGLTEGALPAPLTVAFTPDADATGKAHAQSLKQSHGDITVRETSDQPGDYMTTWLQTQLSASRSQGALDLPLTVLPAEPSRDTMAIIYSGDGGWRDLDSELGDYLRSQGVPAVGVDSLRYFWTKRTPQETAADLKRIMDTYSAQWGVSKVLLVGYSFGADILPAAYDLLPKADKKRVRQLSLLALSPQVDYEVSVSGWLGVQGESDGGKTTDDIAKIRSSLLQCIYGTEEDDDPCPTLKASGVETVPIEGGHHFDEDYQALGKRILDSLDRRLKN
jgi:type IV secretory pathway VirJ component